MSLLFFDGFKNYTYLPLKWDEATTNCGLEIKDFLGRKTEGILAVISKDNDLGVDFLVKKLESSFNEVIFGFAFKRVSSSIDCLSIALCLDTIKQSTIVLNNTGILWYTYDLYDSRGINYVFLLNTWHYVEVRIKIHNEFGEVEIKVDELTKLLLTNMNTSTTSSYVINNVKFGILNSSKTNNVFAYLEDLYILSVSGTHNNYFLGNCSVSYMFPTASGSYTQFTSSTTYSGVDNYEIINDTTYSGSGTTYSATYYEYSGLDDGGYARTSNLTTLLFDNTGVAVFNPMTIYMNINTYASYLWFRFSNINIPKNAKITSAYMILNKLQETVQPETNTQDIFAQKIGTPATQVTSSADFLSRKFTKNKYVTTQGATASNCIITSVIQELVDQTDWQEIDNSVLIVSNIYYSNKDQSWISVGYTSYEANNNPTHVNSPKLYVEWQLPEDTGSKYIYTENIDIVDTYTFNTLSGATSIKAISLNTVANVSGTGMYLTGTTLSGSNLNNSYNLLPKTRYKNNSYIFENNPYSNVPWTISSLATTEFGFTTTSG